MGARDLWRWPCFLKNSSRTPILAFVLPMSIALSLTKNAERIAVVGGFEDPVQGKRVHHMKTEYVAGQIVDWPLYCSFFPRGISRFASSERIKSGDGGNGFVVFRSRAFGPR